MKAIYCEICGTITSPGPRDMYPKECHCGAHRCWWADGRLGQFRVEYLIGHPEARKLGAPWGNPEVWVLGVHNGFLHSPSSGSPTAAEVDALLDMTPDSYIFKKTRSLIVRFRPGQSSDTAWAKFEGPLPKNGAEELRVRNAVEDALKEERRRITNYLYRIPGNGDLVLQIDQLKHLKEEDPT
jgi:hypothetical protein